MSDISRSHEQEPTQPIDIVVVTEAEFEQPKWNDGSEGIDSPILALEPETYRAIIKANAVLSQRAQKDEQIEQGAPTCVDTPLRDTVFLDLLGLEPGDSPVQQYLTGFWDTARRTRNGASVWSQTAHTLAKDVNQSARELHRRTPPPMRRAAAVAMVGLTMLGVGLREKAVADEQVNELTQDQAQSGPFRTPEPILVSYTVPESSPRVLDLATAIDMTPEEVAKQVNQQLGSNLQPGDRLPAGVTLDVQAQGTKYHPKAGETMKELVERFNVPPNLWYAVNPGMKTIPYERPVVGMLQEITVPRPVAIVEVDQNTDLHQLAQLPELAAATDGDPAILHELDEGFDGQTLVLPADTLQISDLGTEEVPETTVDPLAEATADSATTILVETTTTTSTTTPEVPAEPVIPQVAELNAAIDKISILDQRIDITETVNAVKNLDAWFAPNDPDRRSDLPAGYVKMLLPNEAEGVHALSVPASKTHGLERYVSPEAEASRRIFNEALRQFAAIKYPQYNNLVEGRVRDGNSPNHGTHQHGQMLDWSTQLGGSVTDKSTGPVGDSMFSESYDAEFTADMLCFMAKLYAGEKRVVHRIISSDLAMVRRVNATVGYQLMLFDDDNEHKDHIHIIFNKAFNLPSWGLRARDLPWSTEQDLRIGGQAKALTPEQFNGAHHAYQDWFAAKLAKTATTTTTPAPAKSATPTTTAASAPSTTQAPKLTALPKEVLPKSVGIPADIVPLILPSKHFSSIELAAQIHNESNFNPRAVSHANARGISQFIPSTWQAVGRDDPDDPDTIADPFNVVEALDAQRRYMDGQYEIIGKWLAEGKIKGNQHDLTLAAYNAGINAVRRAGGIPNKGETHEYIKRINKDIDTYSRAAITEALDE